MRRASGGTCAPPAAAATGPRRRLGPLTDEAVRDLNLDNALLIAVLGTATALIAGVLGGLA